MDTLQVDLADRGYEIQIGTQLISRVGKMCSKQFGLRKTLVISDANVAGFHLDRVVSSLKEEGFSVETLVLPAGEETKSLSALAKVWEAAVLAKLDRKSFLVALGGGVIGDLAGFAAATYLRGIPFVQVPTSLLAMVDSAVGGKTGMNLPQGKNLVGAFHQPARVLVDLDMLDSLPEREFNAGMAEVIKYGIIWDAELFERIETHVAAIRKRDRELLRELVRRSCEIKADVVRQDEREGGVRALLNYGHTLGHAIENVCGYGKWLHGEAIAIGMVYASRVSERIKGLPASSTARQAALFRAFDLPAGWDGLEWNPLFEAMTVDKKAENATPRFVLIESIGKAHLPERVEAPLLQEIFEKDL